MENNIGKNIKDQAAGCGAFLLLIAIISAPAGLVAVIIYGLLRMANNSVKTSYTISTTIGIIVGIIWISIMLFYGGDGTTAGFRFGQDMMKITMVIFIPGIFGWYWVLSSDNREEERQEKKELEEIKERNKRWEEEREQYINNPTPQKSYDYGEEFEEHKKRIEEERLRERDINRDH